METSCIAVQGELLSVGTTGAVKAGEHWTELTD